MESISNGKKYTARPRPSNEPSHNLQPIAPITHKINRIKTHLEEMMDDEEENDYFVDLKFEL